MQQREFVLLNKGMNRDLSISKTGESAAFENRNIRVTATDKDTLLSVTNERGNRKVENLTFSGTLIGYGVLNDYIILFTVLDNVSRIYRVKNDGDTFSSILIFEGTLGFDADYPIETIVDYETEDILKIYWIDGKNVLRFLNFSDKYLTEHLKTGTLEDDPVFVFDETWFDSTRSVSNSPKASISKDNSGNPRPNGVAQYFLTYYNKYGQQTGILWSSPLVYLSPEGKGGAADQTNNNLVTITLSGLGSSFEYARLYSIVRTSLDGQTTGNIVGESSITDGVATFVDDGAHGTSVEPSSFLFLGSQDAKFGTMTQKDGTLFLGNIRSAGHKDIDDLQKAIRENAFDLHSPTTGFQKGVDWESTIVKFEYSSTTDLSKPKCHIPHIAATGYYPYVSQLKYTNAQISTFKGGEKYRFALRFIRSNGTMSKPFWIGDKVNPYYPKMTSHALIARPIAICEIPDAVVTEAKKAGFQSAKLMIAQATAADRSVKAQGILNPTVFNLYDRFLGQKYAQSSWIYRPKNGLIANAHLSPLGNANSSSAELQCNWWDSTDSNVSVPTPLYYLNQDGSLYNKPAGYSSIGAISVYVYIRRYFVFFFVTGVPVFYVKWYGYFEYKTFADIDSSDPITTRSCNLGSLGDKAGLSKNEFIKEWKKAYDKFDVPVGFRASTRTMESYMDKAKKDSWSKGSSEYYLEPKSPHRATVELTDNQYDAGYSKALRQMYFVDENVVTLNSPELEYNAVSLDRNSGLYLRVIGAAGVTGNISDYTIETENWKYPGEQCIKQNFSHSNVSERPFGLTSWPLYGEYGYQKKSGSSGSYEKLDMAYAYMTYMWQKTGSIPDFGDTESLWSVLKKKRIANLHYAYYSVFNDYDDQNWEIVPDDIRQLSDASASIYSLNINGSSVPYAGDVDDVVIMPGETEYPIYYSKGSPRPDEDLPLESVKNTADPVRLTYNSRSHCVISLPTQSGMEMLLPSLADTDTTGEDTSSSLGSDVTGPYCPWATALATGNRLLYRDANAGTALLDGAYTGFTIQKFDSVSGTLSAKIDLSGDTDLTNVNAMRSLSDAVGKISDTVYVPIADESDTVWLVDMSKMEVNSIYVEATINRKVRDSMVTKWGMSVMYLWAPTMETVTTKLYSSGGIDGQMVLKYSYTAQVNSDSFVQMIPDSVWENLQPPLFVGAEITFKNKAISSITIAPEELSLKEYSLDGHPVNTWHYSTDAVRKYQSANIENASYIDPNTNTETISFVNIEPTPNEKVKLLTSHTFESAGAVTSLYGGSQSSVFELNDDNNLLSKDGSYLLIGELYKDFDSLAATNPALDTRYGGITESAVEANTFVDAGSAVSLDTLTFEGASYSTATLDISSLYDRIQSEGKVNGFSLLLSGVDDAGEPVQNFVPFNNLSEGGTGVLLPTSESPTESLALYEDEDGNWKVGITGLSDVLTQQMANDSSYKVVMLRYGYARRGKWRKYINKYGEEQTSHASRYAKGSYGFRTRRRGERNSLPALRHRIIGADLLYSNLTIEQQSHSSTWRQKDYVNATLVAPIGTAMVLPRIVANKKRVIRETAAHGLVNLYAGLYHKEGNEWKCVSNLVHLRGITEDRKGVWAFTEGNIVLEAT